MRTDASVLTMMSPRRWARATFSAVVLPRRSGNRSNSTPLLVDSLVAGDPRRDAEVALQAPARAAGALVCLPRVTIDRAQLRRQRRRVGRGYERRFARR